jgi:hypothetical protein
MAPSCNGGSMWFMLAIGLWHNLGPGGATRGKWRIPDAKGESGLFHFQNSEGGCPHLCQIRTASVGP